MGIDGEQRFVSAQLPGAGGQKAAPLVLAAVALVLSLCGCTDQSVPTSQNQVVITSCGTHPAGDCILISLKAHHSIPLTNFSDLSVSVADLQLASRVFQFTNSNTFVLYSYPTQPNVRLPDDTKLREAKVRLGGKWYSAHSGTVLVPQDGYSGVTRFTTAALAPKYKGNGNQLWTYTQTPPNSPFTSELRSSENQVLKLIAADGETSDPLDSGRKELPLYRFSGRAGP